MPNIAIDDNPPTLVTSGLSSEDLPTSAARKWQERSGGATEYHRHAFSPRPGTASNKWDQGQSSGFATGAKVTSAVGSQLDPSSRSSSAATSHIVGLQKWVGQIHSVINGLITVELHPLDHDGPTLFADFDLRLLSPDEREAKSGAIVYLTTRMIQGDSGHVEAVTNLRLRHPRRWSRTEISEVKRRGRDRAKSFAGYADRSARP